MGVDAGSNAGSTEGPILLPTLRLHTCHIEQSASLGTVSLGLSMFALGVLIALGVGC